MNPFLVGLGVVLIVYSLVPFLTKGSELDTGKVPLDDRIRTVLLVTCALVGVALLYEGLDPSYFDATLLPLPDMLR